MNNKLLLIGILLLMSLPAFSQEHYSKLVLKKKEMLIVKPGNTVTVDTLIMHDKSAIKFSPDTAGVLQVKVAYIGKKCLITSRGEPGINYKSKQIGTPGTDGGSLEISMHFEQLESLVIDTRGGKGGDGLKGKNGKKGTPTRYVEKTKIIGGKSVVVVEVVEGKSGSNGTDATTGLHGGNGGDINFTYSTSNFIPNFNNTKAKNSITLLHTIGDAGADGIPGKGGVDALDGNLVNMKKPETTNGKLKLTKATLTTTNN